MRFLLPFSVIDVLYISSFWPPILEPGSLVLFLSPNFIIVYTVFPELPQDSGQRWVGRKLMLAKDSQGVASLKIGPRSGKRLSVPLCIVPHDWAGRVLIRDELCTSSVRPEQRRVFGHSSRSSDQHFHMAATSRTVGMDKSVCGSSSVGFG